MPGSSSWMPYAPQGVKGFDDDDDDDEFIVAGGLPIYFEVLVFACLVILSSAVY